MKLALVTETFPPEVNGAAMTFGVIARELARRGHAVTVYRPRRADLTQPDAVVDYHEVSLPGFPIPRYPMLRMGLPAARSAVEAQSWETVVARFEADLLEVAGNRSRSSPTDVAEPITAPLSPATSA
ncbi:MAG: hypothetical protein Q7S40_15285 [Opitutaceae bacterium]|nr:hypothetical protein [Opitutaceae bacterium]